MTKRSDEEPEGTITIPVHWVTHINGALNDLTEELMNGDGRHDPATQGWCDLLNTIQRGLRMRLARVPLAALPRIPDTLKGETYAVPTRQEAGTRGSAAPAADVRLVVDHPSGDRDVVSLVGEVDHREAPSEIDLRNCLVCQKNRRAETSQLCTLCRLRENKGRTVRWLISL